MISFRRKLLLLLALAVCCCVLPGCGGNVAKQQQEESNLKPLMIMYGQFMGRNMGRPPQNEAEFKAYIKTVDAAALESLGVKDVESLFVSTRDKKPYVIIFGAVNGPPGPAGQPVVAYEQEGVSGRRYVASTLGAIEEVDAARFRELVPNAQ